LLLHQKARTCIHSTTCGLYFSKEPALPRTNAASGEYSFREDQKLRQVKSKRHEQFAFSQSGELLSFLENRATEQSREKNGTETRTEVSCPTLSWSLPRAASMKCFPRFYWLDLEPLRQPESHMQAFASFMGSIGTGGTANSSNNLTPCSVIYPASTTIVN